MEAAFLFFSPMGGLGLRRVSLARGGGRVRRRVCVAVGGRNRWLGPCWGGVDGVEQSCHVQEHVLVTLLALKILLVNKLLQMCDGERERHSGCGSAPVHNTPGHGSNTHTGTGQRQREAFAVRSVACFVLGDEFCTHIQCVAKLDLLPSEAVRGEPADQIPHPVVLCLPALTLCSQHR